MLMQKVWISGARARGWRRWLWWRRQGRGDLCLMKLLLGGCVVSLYLLRLARRCRWARRAVGASCLCCGGPRM